MTVPSVSVRRGSVRRGSVLVALVLAAALLGVASPGVAGTDELAPVALSRVSDTHFWSGEFVAGAFGVWPLVSMPGACTPEVCHFVHLDVQLPEQTWQRWPGGMLVAVQTPILELADLDLFVYTPGCGPAICSPAASSTSAFANEAAWIENPVNGRYTVVAAAKLVAGQPRGDGVAEPLAYDGFVKFQRGLTVQREELKFGEPHSRQIIAFGLSERQPVRELLPDLVPTTPRNFQVAFGGRDAQLPGGCLPTETLGEPTAGAGPLRCLRFDQGEYNFGDGPLQLNVYEVEDEVFDVYQRIYASDGSVRQIGPLGDVEFHEDHGHFHYMGFQEITVHRIEEDGSLTFVKTKPDKGICMVDIWMGWFGRTDRPTSPLGYPFLSEGHCVTFSHEDPNDPTFPGKPFFEMGVSVGWADVYLSTLPEQYVDITGAPDGDYALVVRQDVDHHILETDTSNNTAVGCVRLTGDVAKDISCEGVKLPRRTS